MGKLLEELPKERGGNCLEISMILYVFYVAIELHLDTIFFQHFLV